MAKLTNAVRDGIIRQEVDNKFHKKVLEAEKKVTDEIDALAKKSVPAWITEEMKQSGYIMLSNEVYAYKDKITSNWNDREDFEIHDHIPTKQTDYVKIVKTKKIINLQDKLEALLNERKEFKNNLHSVLYSFTTDKKLLEHVPELDKYFQDAQKSQCMAIVPADQIDKVRKMLKGGK